MRTRRASAGMVLPGGLLAGHLLGVGVASRLGSTAVFTWGSGPIKILACAGIPLAMAALLVSFERGRRARPTVASAPLMVVQQVAAFLLVDLIERLLAGLTPADALRDPWFWWAAAVQVLVAVGLWLVLRSAGALGRRVAARTRRVPGAPSAPVLPAAGQVVPAFAVALSSLSRRGPPSGSVQLA
ncbi:hypothetical protein PO878_04500 [Iamia majanohamensis]|uniref:Uncharacterized protein n=1 Tax=Iamia majanohamensis TaxID=467976 RepID=A0AAE9YBB4_9ACTN|nr:hypothetical protein [Iamia majanohamensis]WCO67983.1 hypothetical protein PO878_04500 [Iamia majanohamensis]